MKLVEYFNRQSRAALTLLGFCLILGIGFIDYITGPFIALLIFYLIPVCFVAWFVGRWSGVAIAFVAALAWYAAIRSFPDRPVAASELILVWNALVRLGVFIVSAVLTSEVAERKRVEAVLRHTQQELEVRVQELAQSGTAFRHQSGILQSILNSMGSGVIVADAHGKILLFNPAAEQLLRIGLANATPEEWLKQQETYLPDMLTAYPTNEHPLLRAIRGEPMDGADMFVRHAHAPEGIWLRTTGRPLIDERGTAQGGVIVFSDITSQKLLEKQIAEISDREQRRIGQDLHDGLCQHLVSTAFAAELLREKLAANQLSEATQAEGIADMVNQAITQARHLARGLYPVRLEVDGLASALEEMVANVQSGTNIQCRFACDEPVIIYDEVAGSNLYRIAQEAVNNSIKHGRVKNVSIGLGAVDDEVTLTIKDDGIGFPEVLQKNGGMGLHIMNYRARMIGASLDIRRGAGGGTIVICSFHNENLLDKSHVHQSKK